MSTISGASDRYWCELAVIDGDVREGVTIDVADGLITSVHDGLAAPERGAMPLSGVTVPGIANGHSHVFQRALRHRVQRDRGSFWTWRDVMYAAAARLDPERMHRIARATFAEFACAGYTTVGEFHYVHHQPNGQPYADPNAMGHAVLAAAAEVGIRISLLDTLYLHGGLGVGGHQLLGEAQRRFADPTAHAWVERVEGIRAAPDQQVGGAVHSLRAVDNASLGVVAGWSGGHRIVHAHVSEQKAENEATLVAYGATPVELLHDVGLAGTWFTAVHATHLLAKDRHLLRRSRSNVCLCPTTEADLADGIGASSQLAAEGVPLCIGSDSHAVIDPFEELRQLEWDQRRASGERGHLTSRQLLTGATVDGHAALGWPDAGRLSVGAPADLVTVSLSSTRTAGATASSALDAVVWAASAADVTDVTIAGRPVVRAGRHVTIDVATELDAAVRELTG